MQHGTIGDMYIFYLTRSKYYHFCVESNAESQRMCISYGTLLTV